MKASRLGLREIRVNFGTFDRELICLVGPYANVGKFVAWKVDDPLVLKTIEQDDKSRGVGARGRYYHRRGYIPIIWIPRVPRTPREHATLAHEMLHVVRTIMEWAGIPLNEDTEEAYCHALGHGVEKVLAGLAKPR